MPSLDDAKDAQIPCPALVCGSHVVELVGLVVGLRVGRGSGDAVGVWVDKPEAGDDSDDDATTVIW